jgi:cyclophilin family peptidyl-prolyl cis-trans isomerase
MCKHQFVLFSLICFFMINITAMAQNKAESPKGGPANAEFQRVFGEWKTIVGELGALKAKYRTAQKEERAGIEKKWTEIAEKGKRVQSQLIQATEKAFTEAPNSDKEVTELLLGIFNDKMAQDDYENTARMGKLLVDNKCGDLKTANDAGYSAICIGDFDAAAKYLGMADAGGYYKQAKADDQVAAQAHNYLMNLSKFRNAWEKEQNIREAESKADDLPRVLIKTNEGDIEIELFENEAPIATANFITLVEKGFYNGLTFHRVLENFMAQGGDPKGDGSGGPGYTIPCECYQPNHRLHYRGSLSMAHAGRDTGGSQFFLTFVPTSFLDGKHTVFGRVIKGFDVLAKIQRRDPEKANQPDPDKIIEAKVIRKRPHEYTVKKSRQ